MRLESIIKIFNGDEDFAKKLWTDGVDQRTTDEVADNVFKHSDLQTFLPELFKKMQESLNNDWNSGFCKLILCKIQQHKEYPKYAHLCCEVIIPEVKKLRTDDLFGTFPVWFIPLSKMKECAEELRRDNMAQAASLIKLLKSDETHDPTVKKSKENTGDWHDIDSSFGRFRIGACPQKDDPSREFDNVSKLFASALNDTIHLFVSLNETGESSTKKVTDFWENRVLHSLNVPGWVFNKTEEKELDAEPKKATDYNPPRLVESTIEATNTEGGKKIVLKHLHLDGWKDQSPMCSKKLFHLLQKRMIEIADPQKRIWVNCVGGKGRSPSTAVGHLCMRMINQQLQSKIPLADIKINIAELIYLIRREGKAGAVGQASHIVDLHAWLGDVYDEMISAQ